MTDYRKITGKRPKDFPLYAHRTGYWAKEIRGKTYYFGKIDDPDGSLEKYLAEKDYLRLGKAPPSKEGLTIAVLLDKFLDAKRGEISVRTWKDYRCTCKKIVKKFGGLSVSDMRPEDFAEIREHLQGGSTGTVAKRIREARAAFNFLQEITGDRPRWGKAFREPSAKAKRASKQTKVYAASQVHEFLASGNVQFRAMILLGINCGFGNKDCATIRWTDIKDGWHEHPRPKTGVIRRCKLWPETIEALSKVKTDRRGLVFKTRYGNAWIQEPTETSSRIDSIAQESFKIGMEFYTLRRTFRTIADAVGDERAVQQIMGHVPNSSDMGAVYVQFIEDSRIEKVTDFVREWFLRT